VHALPGIVSSRNNKHVYTVYTKHETQVQHFSSYWVNTNNYY